MARIVLIHGFNVRDGGAKTVDRLKPYLELRGHTVDTDQADYGWFNLWMVRFRKHSAIRRICDALETADVVISHSNGSNFEYKATRLMAGPPRYQVIRLSPALNRKAGLAKSSRRGCVFHTKTDFWVWLSGFLPFHPWGRQGQYGYKGEDAIVNLDFTDMVKGHSDWFSDENLPRIAKRILKCIES